MPARTDPAARNSILGPILGVTAGFLLGAVYDRAMAPEAPAVATRVVEERDAPLAHPAAMLSATRAAADRPETVFEVRRTRGSANLFVLRAKVQPQDDGVELAVDTGAEVTILRQSDAAAMGAQLEPLHDSQVRAVGSTLSMKGAVIPAMTAAGVDFTNTRVLIGPDNLPYSLLGQTEIARLGRVEFEGDVMRIRPLVLSTRQD